MECWDRATRQPTQAIRPLSPLTFRVIGLANQFIRLMGLAFRMAGKASGTASLASRMTGEPKFAPIPPLHTTIFTSFPSTTITFFTGFPSMNFWTFSFPKAACSIFSRLAFATTVI
uniref:Uncharacterized protein n=1 Tax=Candidatus Kentrum sp. UNK TaxID=2126344 RepID=A0A451AJA2_9GAMM|nr:MAG: hypothetical protein BECKUNK1418G_GA0071005_10804 [Candidatus Kentron sp. UNK]VFK71747.1 MAG: hypothetical protein BECKUNK1418H_GA0071006_10814 [Candidatus Kentron sp. UNK]